MRRNWIKLYVDQCLRGSMMSELSAAERWAFVGLLLMAGDSNINGKIFLRKSAEHKLIGYSEETLAELLALTVDEFKKSIAKMIKFKKISVNKGGVITILNWGKYQSEYSRQKKYRESDNKNCNSECNQSNALDIDKDKERDKDKIIYRATTGDLSNEIKPSDPETALSACRENDLNLIVEDIDDEFEQLWKMFPGDSSSKGNKQEAKGLYRGLRKKIYADVIEAGFNGYRDLLKHKKINENFTQRPMNVARFLRKHNWLVNICFKFKAQL